MQVISFKRPRFPPGFIRQAVWLYARFTLSYRDEWASQDGLSDMVAWKRQESADGPRNGKAEKNEAGDEGQPNWPCPSRRRCAGF